MAFVLAQRGGSSSIVLTENMFSSSCITQAVSSEMLWGFSFFFFFFFSPLAAQVQEHMFAFNTLCVLCLFVNWKQRLGFKKNSSSELSKF